MTFSRAQRQSMRELFSQPSTVKNEIGAFPSYTTGTSWFGDSSAFSGGLLPPTEGAALTVSAIYAAVNLIAGAISTMPVKIYSRSKDGELDELPNDPLWWMLNEQFSPRWSAAPSWEFFGQSLLLRGDAFARIRRSRMGEVIGLDPIHYDRVQVVATEDGSRLVYAVAPDFTLPTPTAAKWEAVDQDDMIHVPGFGFNGLRGLSPLRHALRMAAPVAMATQEYSARFFANGARPDFVLESPDNPGAESLARIKEALEERHKGPQNAHRPMLLTNGLKLNPVGLPAEDMQLIATRQFQIEEIARIYGVPPFMLGHNEKTTSWGSGVEAMGIGFVRYTLRQHLSKFENELNRKLFRTSAKCLAFDTSDLTKADMTTQFSAYRIALGRAGEPGFMTTEEVRKRIGLKCDPDGVLLNTPATGSQDPTQQGTQNAPPEPPEPAED